ncbi:MAG TPA: twin-arginine translocation signal domain-containing protein, partial [Cyclobacteriaceae bacterium]|nr:twin-arginine translocation signal domain-containing protein [Cyclobacteriaceae bacterium]
MTTRRSFIKRAAVGTLAVGLAPALVTANNGKVSKNPKRSLRIAHITDVHIIDKPHAEACFERVVKEL